MGGWLHVLGARYFDITMKTGNGIETRVVERPGLWMDGASLKALSHDLKQVASRTLEGRDLNYGVFSGDAERMEHSIVTIVYKRDTHKPIAFMFARIRHRRQDNERGHELGYMTLLK